MAPRLGGMFAAGALGPVYYAGQCLLASRGEEGLRELAVESLRGGLKRGASQAAERAGVAAVEIERLLPMAQLEQILARLAASQPRALEAWKLYAGGLGGMLTGVADLTVDGRAPDTALAVSRLAKKVQRDKPFSQPLQQLADDLFDWQDALGRCVELLNDSTALEAAYRAIEERERRRRLRKIALIAGASIVVLLAVALVVHNRVAHARVLAVIEQSDPCAAMDLSDADLDRVSAELQARAKESRAKCEAGRAAEAKRVEEQRKREEREREEKKAHEALETACESLAAHIDAGKIAPEDAALLKGSAPLFERVLKGALDPADYGPAEPELPCKGTRGEAKIVGAFRKAVLLHPWTVAQIESPSAAVREAIAAGAADLPPKLKSMVGQRAAEEAKKALIGGKPEPLARALSLCETARAMGSEIAGSCDGVRAATKK